MSSSLDINFLSATGGALGLASDAITQCMGRVLRLYRLFNSPLPVLPMPMPPYQHETCHWIERGSNYYEEQTHRMRVGQHAGVSFHMGQGVRYHTGTSASQSYPVTHEVHVDTGQLIITSHRVAFIGSHRSFSIRYRKILAIHPYSNGFQIQKDGVTAKPQMFATADSDAACIMLSRFFSEATA